MGYVLLVKTCDIWTLNNKAKNLLTEDQTKMEKCVLSFLNIPMLARRVGHIWEQHKHMVLNLPQHGCCLTMIDDGLFYIDVCSFMYI